VDAVLAAQNLLLAADDDNPAAVSLTFATREALPPGITTEQRNIRLTNKSSQDIQVSVSLDEIDTIPGVALSFDSGATYLVPAFSEIIVPVTLSADWSQMTYAFPQALDVVQTNPRHWIPQYSGLIKFTGGGTDIRLPWHASIRPVSALSTTSSTFTPSGGFYNVTLEGTGLAVDVDETPSEDVFSRVLPFELVYNYSGGMGPFPDYGLIRQVGVSLFDDGGVPSIAFAVVTEGDFNTPRHAPVEIFLDTNNDFSFDRVLYLVSESTDAFRQAGFNYLTNSNFSILPHNLHFPTTRQTYSFLNNIHIFKSSLGGLGLVSGNSVFESDIYLYNNQGVPATPVSISYNIQLTPYFFPSIDLPVADGTVLNLPIDEAKIAAAGNPKLLLVLPQNAKGMRTQILSPKIPGSYLIIE
jgi:hypothetical protein